MWTFAMSDEEYALLTQVGDEFWIAFSKLCNDTMKRIPESCRDEAEAYLSERASWYGRASDV